MTGGNNLWDNPENWDPLDVPTADDDAIVGSNFNILVGTQSGLKAKSLIVASGTTIKVLGSPAVIETTARFTGNSVLLFDGGTVE